jgi:hypothetical protein
VLIQEPQPTRKVFPHNLLAEVIRALLANLRSRIPGVIIRALDSGPSALPPMRVQPAVRRSPCSRAMQRGGMRGGRAGRHRPGFRGRYVRATPLASFPSSRCQTAHPPSLKLRRASKQARHSLGVGGAVFFIPAARCCPRVLHYLFRFTSASFASSAPNEGRRSAGAGHWQSVALAGRDDNPPERREGASRRSRWRFSAAGPTLLFRQCPPESAPRLSPRPDTMPGRSGPRLPRPRFAPGLGTPLPRSALGASPETPLVSEDGFTLLYPLFVVNHIMCQIRVVTGL